MREKLIKFLVKAEMAADKNGFYNCNPNIEKAKFIADHLIANGVTIQKWIPVTEPPKERACYLVTVKHWLDGKPVTREAFWNGCDWLSCYWKKGDRVELTPRVTHWMPLPEPPKD